MNIPRITFQGYRSLRDVFLVLNSQTVLVGPNNAGKSNIVDAISFYKDVLFNLDFAISSRGGFQHLAFRGIHGQHQRITISVIANLSVADVAFSHRLNGSEPEPRIDAQPVSGFQLAHELSIAPEPSNLLSGFRIEHEEVSISALTENGIHQQVMKNGMLVDTRDGIRSHRWGLELSSSLKDLLIRPPFQVFDSLGPVGPLNDPYPRLLIDQLRIYSPVVDAFSVEIATSKVYRVDPLFGRAPGLPSVTGDVSANGQQLPSLVAFLQARHPKEWARAVQWVREVSPSVSDIEVRSDHDRLLHLEFIEAGLALPWTDNEVSDGTIRSVALFAALSDPRWRLQVFEEPENSLHPWAIRSFVNACHEVTTEPPPKQIVLTTHSPALIDFMTPDDILVVWRQAGETQVLPLVTLDPTARAFWAEGHGKISELLASGLHLETVPLGS